MLADLIADVPVDWSRRERDLASKPVARHRYAILFTPRSGSTWLTSLLRQQQQRLYGQPTEYLNPKLVRRLAEEMNANTLQDYFEMLVRSRSSEGVFEIKVACQQLKLLLAETTFDEVFARYRWIICGAATSWPRPSPSIRRT